VLPGVRLTAAGDKHPDDIAEAKRLLDEAGLGTDWELTLSYRTVVQYPVIAPVIKDQLQKNLGITVKLEALESSAGLTRWRDLDFGMAIQGHAFSTYVADAIFSALYRPGGTRNYADYADPVLEELFPQQAAELDATKRLELIQQMSQRLFDVPGPWIPIYWTQGGPRLAHKSVKGVFGTPSTQNQLKNENFWFDPSEL
jgi:ABC-type transport system substrate-binding protein